MQRLKNVEAKGENLEKMYGSLMVWKIGSYRDRFADAKSGRETTIYSPTFLTGRHGYKLLLSSCLYGDGKGITISWRSEPAHISDHFG